MRNLVRAILLTIALPVIAFYWLIASFATTVIWALWERDKSWWKVYTDWRDDE